MGGNEIYLGAIKKIIPEAITNIIRHARATECFVDVRENDGCITLSIQDNGSGFDANTSPGMGIINMRENAYMTNERASFEIISELGVGTTIIVRFPLADHEGAEGLLEN